MGKKAFATTCGGAPGFFKHAWLCALVVGSHLVQAPAITQPQPKGIFFTNIRQYASSGSHSCQALPHPFLLPHEMFSALMGTDPGKVVGPDGPSKLALFWDSVSNQPWCAAQLERINKDKAIPVGLHGDDASSGKLKLLVFSWSGLLPRGSALSTRFLITAVPFSRIVPDETVREILEVITYSFQAMRAGTFPGPFQNKISNTRPHLEGSHLTADGYNAVLADVRGDWKFHVEVFGLTKSYRHQQICHLCGCLKEDTCRVLFESSWAQIPERQASLHGHVLALVMVVAKFCMTGSLGHRACRTMTSWP